MFGYGEYTIRSKFKPKLRSGVKIHTGDPGPQARDTGPLFAPPPHAKEKLYLKKSGI